MAITNFSASQQPDSTALVTNDAILTEHAHVILTLGNRVKADVIEIGRRLKDAQERAGHGYWLKWLDSELGWSTSTAERFINVYEFSQAEEFKFVNLTLPVSAIYLLAAPSTPAEARTEIIEAAKAGEVISVEKVKVTIARAKGRSHKSKSIGPQKTIASRFDAALAWWSAATLEARQRLLDNIGSTLRSTKPCRRPGACRWSAPRTASAKPCGNDSKTCTASCVSVTAPSPSCDTASGRSPTLTSRPTASANLPPTATASMFPDLWWRRRSNGQKPRAQAKDHPLTAA
jgi:hypothetical protein